MAQYLAQASMDRITRLNALLDAIRYHVQDELKTLYYSCTYLHDFRLFYLGSRPTAQWKDKGPDRQVIQ
jgi:hypothetical protein